MTLKSTQESRVTEGQVFNVKAPPAFPVELRDRGYPVESAQGAPHRTRRLRIDFPPPGRPLPAGRAACGQSLRVR